jgi:D-glycero-D-manno-heptose 1,7-bisphosphate phosphatase
VSVPAVFLDRDGVLNEVLFRDGLPVSPRTVAEFRPAAGVREAVERLRAAGFLALVVTNQPDVARGLIAPAEFDGIMKALRAAAPVDDVAFCPHDDGSSCHCRKPKPGMVTDLAARHDVDLARSVLVGDTWKDMEAGKRAGVTTILLRRPYNGNATGDLVVDTLDEAVRHILQTGRP